MSLNQVEALKAEVIKLTQKVQLLETEQIKELQTENKKLAEKIQYVESKKSERFVTVKELAEVMKCTERTVLRKIAEKEIYATRKLGNPRIPLNQFYEKEPVEILKRKPGNLRKVSGGESMEELIFGNREN